MARRLLLAMTIAVVGLADPSSGAIQTTAGSAAYRILYSSDWPGPTQIYAVDPTGRAATGQLTFGPAPACSRRPGVACGFVAPKPSPDGRKVLFWDDHYGARETTLFVARADGHGRRVVARSERLSSSLHFPEASWSPDSRRIAYLKGDWHVVRADGTGDRVVSSPPPWVRGSGVSPDGRWVAAGARTGLRVSSMANAAGRTFPFDVRALSWSPDSRLLAFSTSEGIRLLEIRTNRLRLLTGHTGSELAWSPDGSSVAFVEAGKEQSPDDHDLRVVALSGRVRTVVDAAGNHGGYISGVVWTRKPSGFGYRRASPRFAVSAGELAMPWRIDRLATDGDRAAYASCGHVFVWTPGSAEVRQAEPAASLSPRCSTPSDYRAFWTYDLALAGNRVAWGELSGNMGRSARLEQTTLAPRRETVTLAEAHGAGGPHTWRGIGELSGSDGLLVFSSWSEQYVGGSCCAIFTAEQSVRRTESRGCPCPALRTEPGPLVPLDVDDGRIAAGGDNALLVLDRNGAQLLSVPIRAAAASLSGPDLVVLVPGQLRHYDAESGALLHTWPLPEVPSGHTCGSLNVGRCYPSPRLLLEDGARGLVTYIFDGQVRVLRLSDGADAVVASGVAAGFVDSGLVYADGSRLRHVPFDRLAVRS